MFRKWLAMLLVAVVVAACGSAEGGGPTASLPGGGSGGSGAGSGSGGGGGDDGYDDGYGNGSGSASPNAIRLQAAAFQPPELRVERGATVVWENQSGVEHTITPDGHSAWMRVAVPSSSGEALSVTFDDPGTYAFYCEPHREQGMTGRVIVE